MKRVILFVMAFVVFTSCSTLKNTATHRDFSVATPYAVPIIADLEVSETRIMYPYVPPRSVKIGGTDNVIKTAVREALAANGDADVLVGMETQIKYNAFYRITSIVITGYPAKYKNFRNLDENIWYNNEYFQTKPETNGYFIRK